MTLPFAHNCAPDCLQRSSHRLAPAQRSTRRPNPLIWRVIVGGEIHTPNGHAVPQNLAVIGKSLPAYADRSMRPHGADRAEGGAILEHANGITHGEDD